jgi:hypothetical protein
METENQSTPIRRSPRRNTGYNSIKRQRFNQIKDDLLEKKSTLTTNQFTTYIERLLTDKSSLDLTDLLNEAEKFIEDLKKNAEDKKAKLIIREGLSAIDELISSTKSEDKVLLERRLIQTNIIISSVEAKLELEEKKVVVLNYLIRKKNDETGIVKLMSKSILNAITSRKRSRLSDEDEDESVLEDDESVLP